jgi:hypothetical protein
MSAMVQESTPRQRIGAAVSRDGEEAFVDRCLSVLAGGEVDVELIEVLGGKVIPARSVRSMDVGALHRSGRS